MNDPLLRALSRGRLAGRPGHGIRFRSTFSLVVVANAAMLVAACGSVGSNLGGGGGPDGDEVRDRAMAVFVDRSVTDRINASEDDRIDWKYVDVIDPGTLRVTVSVDRPEKLKKGEIELFDEFGNPLQRFPVEAKQTVYVFDQPIDKLPNKYFVKMTTRRGQSAYTVGVAVQAPAPPPRPVVVAPPPTPEPMIAEPPRRTRPRVNRPRHPPARPKRPPTRAVAEQAAGSTVRGRVLRVTPEAGNKAVKIAVRLSSGTVSRGAHGRVFKNGQLIGPLTVVAVSGKTVQARVNEPPGKFSGKLTVVIDAN